MKKVQIPSFIKGFLSCLIIVILFSFSILKQNFQADSYIFQVDENEALIFRSNYKNNLPNDPEGMNISFSQYKAIEQVVNDMRETPSQISGFRLYHGLKSNNISSERVSCVYTMSSNFSEPISGSTGSNNMVTIANNLEHLYTKQCPIFCD